MVGDIDVRVRPVVNGPKAPAGRFRSMPPRRPLVGGVELLPSIDEAPAAWAHTLCATNMKNRKRIQIGLGFTDDRLKSNPPKDKHVFRAMIRNHAYDVQSEGDRSFYAERLFLYSRNRKALSTKFKYYINNIPDDLYWGHKDHALKLAARLVSHGVVESQNVIDLIIYHQGIKDNFINLDILLDLGKEGVISYLNIHGEEHAVDNWSEYYPYEERNSLLIEKIKVLGIKAKDLKPKAKSFIKDIKNWRRSNVERTPRFESFDDYVKHIEENWFRGRASKFFQSFSEDQMKIVESRLSTATKEHEIAGLMEPIVELGIHGPYKHLLKWVSHKNRIIRRNTINILSTVKSKTVRKRAINIIKSGKRLRNGIVLLGINTKPKDDKLIYKSLKQVDDKDTLHECGYGLMMNEDISKKGSLKKSFQYIYYNSRCGVCRASILHKYLHHSRLPRAEQKAMRFDSFDEIREIK